LVKKSEIACQVCVCQDPKPIKIANYNYWFRIVFHNHPGFLKVLQAIVFPKFCLLSSNSCMVPFVEHASFKAQKLIALPLFFKLGTPKNIKYNNVKVSLENIEGVVAAHSLHIWSLTVNKAALSVHLAIGWYSEL